jgi:invasion protein IalB
MPLNGFNNKRFILDFIYDVVILSSMKILKLFAFIPLMVASANAQTLDNTYTAWSVFTIMQEGSKVCYMTSAPSGKDFKGTRDEPYALVTFRNATTTEVSISGGYAFKEESIVKATVGKDPFELFTTKETPKLAWAKDAKIDQTMVERMAASDSMIVEGVAADGTKSVDGYDLKGFPDAYKRMRQLCMTKTPE